MQQHPKGRFYQSEPPRFPKATASDVVDELRRLVELCMLDVEKPDDSRRIYYVRTNSALWDVIAVAAQASRVVEGSIAATGLRLR